MNQKKKTSRKKTFTPNQTLEGKGDIPEKSKPRLGHLRKRMGRGGVRKKGGEASEQSFRARRIQDERELPHKKSHRGIEQRQKSKLPNLLPSQGAQ